MIFDITWINATQCNLFLLKCRTALEECETLNTERAAALEKRSFSVIGCDPVWVSSPMCSESGIWGQRWPRSICAVVQSDQGLDCQLTESLDTTECMNGERGPRWYFAPVQDDLNLCILHMFEGTFCLMLPR